MRKLVTLFAVLGMVLALAPAAQAAIVKIDSATATTTGTVGDPQTIVLDSFTVGSTTYNTSDLVTGTSSGGVGEEEGSGAIANMDNFDVNLGASVDPDTWTTSFTLGAGFQNLVGAEFFIFEIKGNDGLSVRAIFVGGGTGDELTLVTDGAFPSPIAPWGDVGVAATDGHRTGDAVGLTFSYSDLLKSGGGNLTDEVITGLEFTGAGVDPVSISALVPIRLDGHASEGSVLENEAIGTVVGTLNMVYVDSWSVTNFSIIGGADQSSFTIDGTSLKTAEIFDRESQSSYVIDIQATDNAANTNNGVFTITIDNVSESFGIYASASVAPGTKEVATLQSVPGDNTSVTYTFIAGPSGYDDQAKFGIAGDVLSLNDSGDAVLGSEYWVTVQAEGDDTLDTSSIFIKVTVENTVSAGTIFMFR
jgi:hypothetical protein